MTRLTRADLGWVAGVIEAKARITIKRNKMRVTPQVVLVVDKVDPAIVDKLCTLTGVEQDTKPKKTPKEWMRHPCVEHCPEPHQHVGEHEWEMPQTYTWALTGFAAAVLLWNIQPYMTPSAGAYRSMMREVFDMVAYTGHGSGAVKKAARRMMDLGWQLPPEVEEKLFVQENVA